MSQHPEDSEGSPVPLRVAEGRSAAVVRLAPREPPSLEKLAETFLALANMAGREVVIFLQDDDCRFQQWRSEITDPLALAAKLDCARSEAIAYWNRANGRTP